MMSTWGIVGALVGFIAVFWVGWFLGADFTEGQYAKEQNALKLEWDAKQAELDKKIEGLEEQSQAFSAALDRAILEGENNARERLDSVIADLESNNRGLRVRLASAERRAEDVLSSDSTITCVGNGARAGELSINTSKRLARRRSDADRAVRKLSKCQAWAKHVEDTINVRARSED